MFSYISFLPLLPPLTQLLSRGSPLGRTMHQCRNVRFARELLIFAIRACHCRDPNPTRSPITQPQCILPSSHEPKTPLPTLRTNHLLLTSETTPTTRNVLITIRRRPQDSTNRGSRGRC